MEIIIRSIAEEETSILIDIISNPVVISLIGVIFGMFSAVLLSRYEDKKKSKYIVNEFVIKELYKEYLFIRNRKNTHSNNFLTFDRCQKLSEIVIDQLHNILNISSKSLKQSLKKLLELINEYNEDEENSIKIYEQLEQIVNKIN